MLWKAFEDAEAHIAGLERQLAGASPTDVAVDKVKKIPGLKATDAEKLRSFGINLTDELLHADLDKLAAATGIERAELQRWRDISELVALNGVGPKWAERLVDAGVTSIQQMAELSPEDLVKLLLKHYERRGHREKELLLMQRTLPSRCRRLIKVAKKAAAEL